MRCTLGSFSFSGRVEAGNVSILRWANCMPFHFLDVSELWRTRWIGTNFPCCLVLMQFLWCLTLWSLLMIVVVWHKLSRTNSIPLPTYYCTVYCIENHPVITSCDASQSLGARNLAKVLCMKTNDVTWELIHPFPFDPTERIIILLLSTVKFIP